MFKAFLLSALFLVLVLLAVCVDHLIDALLARSYGKTILYGILCLLLLLVLLIHLL